MHYLVTSRLSKNKVNLIFWTVDFRIVYRHGGSTSNCVTCVVQENLAGWTALHIAARQGDARLAAWLSSRCAGVQVRARDFAGRTPRRLARRTHAARAFADLSDDSDSDSDDDDDVSISFCLSR